MSHTQKFINKSGARSIYENISSDVVYIDTCQWANNRYNHLNHIARMWIDGHEILKDTWKLQLLVMGIEPVEI